MHTAQINMHQMHGWMEINRWGMHHLKHCFVHCNSMPLKHFLGADCNDNTAQHCTSHTKMHTFNSKCSNGMSIRAWDASEPCTRSIHAVYFVPIKIGFILVVARSFVFCLFIFRYYHRYRASLKYTQNATCIISTKKRKKKLEKACLCLDQPSLFASFLQWAHILFSPLSIAIIRWLNVYFQLNSNLHTFIYAKSHYSVICNWNTFTLPLRLTYFVARSKKNQAQLKRMTSIIEYANTSSVWKE